LGQGVDDFLPQGVTEVFIVGIAAHVGERQDRDGGRLFNWGTAGQFERSAQIGYGLETLSGTFA
jgi:hypothetical protein